jgi:hypothetical protein
MSARCMEAQSAPLSTLQRKRETGEASALQSVSPSPVGIQDLGQASIHHLMRDTGIFTVFKRKRMYKHTERETPPPSPYRNALSIVCAPM